MSRSVRTVLFHGQNVTKCHIHLYRIYSNPTHEKHQLLLLEFIVSLMMDAKGVRNMYSILAVVNKHITARVASCCFIIYYRLMMHGNPNIKFILLLFITNSHDRSFQFRSSGRIYSRVKALSTLIP